MSTSNTTSVPRHVTIAAVLWIPQIVLQVVVIALMIVMVVQAVSLGGPAYDYIIFIAAPVGVPVAIITAVEVLCVIRLRKASRAARVTLAILAGLTALYALARLPLLIIASTQGAMLVDAGTGTLDFALWEIPTEIVASGLLVAATVLTLTPSARTFFRRRTQLAPEEPVTQPLS